jgi:hypothetical protein
MQDSEAVNLFPTLYDISSFVNRDHPKLHPESLAYTEYWENHERKAIEGMWGNDTDGINGGWRFMPGNLYYYINLCKIILEEKGTTTKANPYLRDVEWMLSYGWLAARKFSGFVDDLNISCHRILAKIHKEGIESLTPKESVTFQMIELDLRKPDGSLKEYELATDYLYRTHKVPLGKPLYQNESLNFFVLGSRGFGKSYYCANAVIGHEFNFYGKKFMDESYLIDPSPVEIFVGAATAAKSGDLLAKFAMNQEHLKTGPGAYGASKDFIPGYFTNNTSGTLSTNATKPYKHEYEEKVNGVWISGGSGTSIKHGVYTTENPQAAAGTRPSVMVIEEVGLLPNLLTVHGSNETCQIRDTKFGSSFYIGTGGNMDKIVESKLVFYDPIAYNFVPFPDLWEGNATPIGFFMPSYYVDNTFKDKNGNTDVKTAYSQEMYERSIREKASTSNALTEYMMARPIVPSEMFLSAKNLFFPVALLKERVTQLIKNPPKFSTGTLEFIPGSGNKEVKFVIDHSLKPIQELNLKSDTDTAGALVVYEHPSDYTDRFRLKKPLYKIVYDPVKDDGFGTSLASIIVYKGHIDDSWKGERDTLSNDIVAEYIGRLERVEDIHEVCAKISLYFGGRIMVENNLPDFIRYCRLRGLTGILQPSPYQAISKIIKNPGRKYDVGVTMSKNLNVQCEQLINDILNEDYLVPGTDKIVEWLFKIKSVRLLLELISYNRDGNFDHVSGMKLLALWIKNEMEYTSIPTDREDTYRKKWNDDLFRLIKGRAYA